MNNLNDPLYVAAVNGARISERRGVALEELAREATRTSREPRSPRGLARLVVAAWTQLRRPRPQLAHHPRRDREIKAAAS